MILLQAWVGVDTQALCFGINLGIKTTGLALMREPYDGQRHVLYLFDLVHRCFQTQKASEQRRGFRRRRRSKNLRYRTLRFDNRTHKTGWLPHGIQHHGYRHGEDGAARQAGADHCDQLCVGAV
ncbi:RRXRR domain-containing protein [Vreelandella massiliensis]|uniref:RRXRR domain-containing protein n=1 Tax=Vreelandella massiliensis TaxID=1816686 RepID=UPI00096A64F2|nr:RRXRR domain-containing protein [Halomonas massiliensis]